MYAYQRLFGDDRSEPVQIEALEDHQGNHGGIFVLICRMRCSLWVNQTDGGAGTSISFKARHWSIVQPGKRNENISMKQIIFDFSFSFIQNWQLRIPSAHQ